MLLLGHLPAISQVSDSELPYLIIPPLQLPDRFGEFEKQQVSKIVLKGCAKQKGYQVIIGDPPSHKKTKWQIYKITLEVVFNDSKKEFGVVASLVDARKNKVFNSITEGEIQELEFFRKLEIIIDRLFLPPVNYTENIASTQSEKPSRPKPDPVVPVVPEAQEANINFRERIMDLKQDINAAIAKVSKANAEAKKNDSGKDGNNEPKKKPNNAVAEASNLEKELQMDPQPKPPKPEPPLDIGNSIRVGYYSFTTNSQHLVETDSRPKYLMVDYEYARPWKKDSNFYHHANLRFGKNQNKEEKEFGSYLGMGLWEGYHVTRYNWMPKLGLEVDTISFKNLPEVGKGLKIANNQIFWFTISSVNNFKMFNRGFRFSVSYGVPLGVMSSYEPLKDAKLSGSKINFTIAALNVFHKFHLELNYFSSSLNAPTPVKPLTFSTTGVGLNAFYNF